MSDGDGADWRKERQELLDQLYHLGSLDAEFAAEDVALAEAGIDYYADSLMDEDN